MSEIKFTEEELKQVGDLQVKYNEVTNKLGQLSIARSNVKNNSNFWETKKMGYLLNLNQFKEKNSNY